VEIESSRTIFIWSMLLPGWWSFAFLIWSARCLCCKGQYIQNFLFLGNWMFVHPFSAKFLIGRSCYCSLKRWLYWKLLHSFSCGNTAVMHEKQGCPVGYWRLLRVVECLSGWDDGTFPCSLLQKMPGNNIEYVYVNIRQRVTALSPGNVAVMLK